MDTETAVSQLRTALTHGFGFDATGVEWSEKHVSLANQLFSPATTLQGGALEFKGYADYDGFYYYGPFPDEALQRRFEEKVEAEAKVGAVIIGNRKASDAWRSSNRFELLSPDGFMGLFLRKVAASGSPNPAARAPSADDVPGSAKTIGRSGSHWGTERRRQPSAGVSSSWWPP